MADERLNSKLALSLFFLRLGVGIVFLMWTIDKFINPTHAAAVFSTFYKIPSLSEVAAYAVGAIQLIVVIAFLLGILKKYSYLIILIMHLVSTVSSYPRYFDPWATPNLLFFAAIPMLAACWALWSLRDYDVIFTFGGSKSREDRVEP